MMGCITGGSFLDEYMNGIFGSRSVEYEGWRMGDWNGGHFSDDEDRRDGFSTMDDRLND
jgi:hypothetical protein